MASHSNDNVYKPKVTGFLIAAIALVLLIVVVLASTILLISTTSASDKSDAPSTTAASAKTSSPEVSTDGGTTTTAPETSGTGETPVGSDETPQTTLPPTTDTPVTPTDPSRVPTKVSPDENSLILLLEDMNEGSLLLLDKDHTYKKDPSLLISRTAMGNLSADKRLEEYGFALISGNANYTVAGSNRFINSDALYYLNEMMADYVKESGNTDVQIRNGYYYSGDASDIESMEHATGYYIDMQIFRSNGTYPLNYETLKNEYYNWFLTNGWKYGYIHVRDTGSYSTFRFVGAAHAALMNKYGFTLEQYISAVTAYSYTNYLSVTDGFGWEWRVYYVKSTGESTSVPVIGTEDSYDVSGNNLNGYIVAINTSCFS